MRQTMTKTAATTHAPGPRNQSAVMKKGWQIKKLSEVCEKITDGTHQTPTYFITAL